MWFAITSVVFGAAIGLNVFAGWQTGSGNFKKEDEELRQCGHQAAVTCLRLSMSRQQLFDESIPTSRVSRRISRSCLSFGFLAHAYCFQCNG